MVTIFLSAEIIIITVLKGEIIIRQIITTIEMRSDATYLKEEMISSPAGMKTQNAAGMFLTGIITMEIIIVSQIIMIIAGDLNGVT